MSGDSSKVTYLTHSFQYCQFLSAWDLQISVSIQWKRLSAPQGESLQMMFDIQKCLESKREQQTTFLYDSGLNVNNVPSSQKQQCVTDLFQVYWVWLEWS